MQTDQKVTAFKTQRERERELPREKKKERG